MKAPAALADSLLTSLDVAWGEMPEEARREKITDVFRRSIREQ
jgi:hypothetical protein